MTTRTPFARQLEEIAAANRLPINVAAGSLLPLDWQGGGALNVLALIRWLVQERGVEDTFRPGVESVLAMLDRMDRWPPSEALEYLTTNDSGDPWLTELPEDREEAAVELLQALVDKMIATAP